VDVLQTPGVSEARPTGLDRVSPQEEVTPTQPPDPLAQKRAGVLDLIQRKPLAEVPEVLREPLRITHRETNEGRSTYSDDS